MLGLIGDARMRGAIWSFARQFLGAAETKVRLGRIADRPTAHRLAQFIMVTGSDIGTTTSLTVWGAAASITNVRKARAVLPTTCGLFACRWAARRGALWCGGARAHCPGAPWRDPIARAGRPCRSPLIIFSSNRCVFVVSSHCRQDAMLGNTPSR